MRKDQLRDLLKYLKPFPKEIQELAIAVGNSSHNVHFGFLLGIEINDPKRMLLILATGKDEFPSAYLKKLMKKAYTNSLMKAQDKKEIREGRTIVKSISTPKKALL